MRITADYHSDYLSSQVEVFLSLSIDEKKCDAFIPLSLSPLYILRTTQLCNSKLYTPFICKYIIKDNEAKPDTVYFCEK